MVVRQTISFLQQRFREVGLQPNARHGQNFLIDLNLLDLIARAAQIGRNDVVLEVGTGTGSLTSRLASKAGHVVTVEIDEHLHLLASEELIDFDNVTLLHFDALKNKNRLSDELLETVRAKLAERPGSRFKLAANLPYNVATPILANLLTSDPSPVSMTATIQRELGERMIARPSTKDYSALSVWVQALCDVEIVRIMPPDVFWPRPKVDSAIVNIVPNPAKRARIPDVAYFHAFARAMFFHRRKYLRSVLISAYMKTLEKSDIDQAMTTLGLGGDARAEQLDIEAMLRLCETMRQAELAKGSATSLDLAGPKPKRGKKYGPGSSDRHETQFEDEEDDAEEEETVENELNDSQETSNAEPDGNEVVVPPAATQKTSEALGMIGADSPLASDTHPEKDPVEWLD